MKAKIFSAEALLNTTLAIGVLLPALFASPVVRPPGYDREVYRYVGTVIRLGGKPYVDVYDNKPPLIYWLNALAHPWGPFGIWIFEALLCLAAAICLYRKSKRDRWPWPLFYPLWFAALYWAPTISAGGGLTRGFTACLALILLTMENSDHRRALFGKGFLLGTIFLIQQEQIIGLLPIVALWTLDWPSGKRRARLAAMGLGLVIPLALVAGTLLMRGLLRPAWEQAFLFNSHAYAFPLPATQRLLLILYAVRTSPLRWILLGQAVLTALCLSKFSQKLRILALWCAGLGQFVITVFLGTHLYAHYWLGALPGIVVLSGVLLDLAARLIPAIGIAAILCSLWILSPAPGGRSLHDGLRALAEHRRHFAYYDEYAPLYDKMKGSRGQRGQLYVFRFMPPMSLYSDLDIIAPAPETYVNYRDLPNWDPEGKRLASILESLDRYQTQWVLDYTPAMPLSPLLQKNWNTYMATHYEPVMRAGNAAVLFRRKSLSDSSR